MGCSAAINAIRLASHIVRSEPAALVLMVNIELCSLHLQETRELERLLSGLLFGDGCAAAMISSDARGIALRDFRTVTIPESAHLITWRVGAQGFEMHLSGERSEEHTSELQSLMRISYAVFCLKKKKNRIRY